MHWHEHGSGYRGRGRRSEEESEERGRGRRGGRGRGFGRPGGWQNVDLPPADDAQAWFEGRLPSEWFTSVTVTVDREEITVIGTLADEATDDGAAAEGRISRFRADTRALFTHISVPVMTRLRQPERQVLDTLVDAGVARSRSEALAWAVKLVGEHAESWLADLRGAMEEVDKLRATGPDFGDPTSEV